MDYSWTAFTRKLLGTHLYFSWFLKLYIIWGFLSLNFGQFSALIFLSMYVCILSTYLFLLLRASLEYLISSQFVLFTPFHLSSTLQFKNKHFPKNKIYNFTKDYICLLTSAFCLGRCRVGQDAERVRMLSPYF